MKNLREPLMLAYWEQILNGLEYEICFPGKLHATGLRLLDLVAAADLPVLTQVHEPTRMPMLRTRFETLHNGAHPPRLALEKLSTLDTISIIEGKA